MRTYFDKALTAVASARRDLASEDYDGAANRAYYAAFYLAIALLESVGEENPGKTHSTLLRRFSERFVRTGEAPADLGRALTAVYNLRSKADYTRPGASRQDAIDAIAATERVFEFARARLATGPEGKLP